MAFRKATKRQQKLRLAISGPAGSGKTYTALTFARELAGPNGRIAVIDTERDSASLYAGDVADFEVDALERFGIDDYLRAIQEARKARFDVLVIDGISHAWAGRGGLLEQKDNIAGNDKKKGFTAWSQLTPQHHRFIDAMLTYPGHLVATMRSKQSYQIVTEFVDGRTKNVVQKLGMEPVQRDDIPYEFSVMFDMDETNTATVVKTRCKALRGKSFPEPGKEVIDILRAWLEDGAPEEQPRASTAPLAGAAATPPASPPQTSAPATTTSSPAPSAAPSTASTPETPSTTTTTTEEPPPPHIDAAKLIAEGARGVLLLEQRKDLVEWARWMRGLPARKRGDKTEAWTAFQKRCVELGLSAREVLDEADGNDGKAA